MKYWNVSVSVLDPELHTAKSVLARCPFLFTVGTALSLLGSAFVLMLMSILQYSPSRLGTTINVICTSS